MKENYGPFTKAALWLDTDAASRFRLLETSDVYKYRNHWICEVAPGFVYVHGRLGDTFHVLYPHKPDFFETLAEYVNATVLFKMVVIKSGYA